MAVDSDQQVNVGERGTVGQRGTVDSMPVLDRSRAHLRIPADLVSDSLRLAHIQSVPNPGTDPQRLLPEAHIVERLQRGGMMVDGRVDPVAAELLDVVNHASLMVAVDLSFGADSSAPTVLATPRGAVVSSSLDPSFVEFRPVQVAALPQVLSELIVLRSPRFVGDAPISVASDILASAIEQVDNYDVAIKTLMDGGLEADQAVLVIEFHNADVRRWRITSTWSTDDGPRMAEMQGLDGGDNGQWMIATTGNGDAQTTFTPQGHGEVMSAFRGVLPRNWLGRPLSRPPE